MLYLGYHICHLPEIVANYENLPQFFDSNRITLNAILDI